MVSLQTAPTIASDARFPLTSARRRLTALERRAQLQEIARDLFAQHGYHHISMDDIALAAAVTKPVLYKHFPSKLELYLAIIESLSVELVHSVDHELSFALASAPAPANAYPCIKAVIDAYVRFVHDNGLAASLLFESDVTRDNTLRDRLLMPNLQVRGLLESALCSALQVEATHLTQGCESVVAIARALATELLHATASDPHASLPITDTYARFAWDGLRGTLLHADAQFRR